jgi:transposase InsO family protein
VDTLRLGRKEFTMPRTRSPYRMEFRLRMVELARSGRTPEELSREFEPSELLDRRRFRTQAEARMAVFDFIEGFYNPRRRHSSLGYLSPLDYERRTEVAI